MRWLLPRVVRDKFVHGPVFENLHMLGSVDRAFANDAKVVIPREHLKILRQCSPASAALMTQSPTSRLPSTPAPVVDYDGGRRCLGWLSTGV